MGAQNSDTGACTSMCKTAKCGDGLVEAGVEMCDMGAQNSDMGACTTMCKTAGCGDGFVETGVEQCDMGMQNSDTGACTTMCKTAACGDGFVQMGVEQCDMGAQNSDTGACTTMCKTAVCGDGLVQMGVEQCDMGMQNSNTGACTLACKNAKCGDGYVQAGVEQCDDGDMIQGNGCNNDCIPSGTPVWTKSFNGNANGDDVFRGAAADAAGNSYVAGFTTTAANGVDAVVRKYDPMGNLLWAANYDGAAHLDDAAYGVTVDAAGNVYAVGVETGADMHLNLWLRKHSSAGVPQWTKTYNIGAAGFDNVLYGVAINAAGDAIYVVGSGQNTAATGLDIVVGKIATINGTEVWIDTFNGAATSNDEGFGVAVDAAGDIVVTGYTVTAAAGADTWVRKYHDNGNTVSQVWTRTYNDLANGGDFGFGIATDATNNVFVAGTETVTGKGYNVWVRKYDSGGTAQWTQTYNNVSNKDDYGLAVACDKSGNVIVSGEETLANGTGDVWVRKYNPAGGTMWTQGYDGAADQEDAGNAVAVDGTGFIYVAGIETTANNGINGWLRKYEP